nr:MAG TPA: hypothetical protein [Caudoviricetes sp.]
MINHPPQRSEVNDGGGLNLFFFIGLIFLL